MEIGSRFETKNFLRARDGLGCYGGRCRNQKNATMMTPVRDRELFENMVPPPLKIQEISEFEGKTPISDTGNRALRPIDARCTRRRGRVVTRFLWLP